MSTGEAIVIAIRLLVPLLILRWALGGGIAAMLADALDVVLVSMMDLGGFGDHYAQLDKVLDTYYLTIEAYVALGWESRWAKWPALALYAYRVIGAAAFEYTGERWLLLVFPNVFENWWLYVVAAARFAPSIYPRNLRTTAIPLVLLLIPKLVQEYILHYLEWKPWDWTKEHVLGIE